jgi:hypothetical protein
MTTKVKIGQSLRIAHAALITHLDSFEKSATNTFKYYFYEDLIGVYHFDLYLIEEGYEGANSNLGSIKLRSLGSKLTEMVMEDSVWLNNEPNLVSDVCDRARVNVKKRKASYDRIQSTHQEVRDYIIQALKEDRLLDTSETKSKDHRQQHIVLPNMSTRVFISYAHEDIELATKLYQQLKAIDGVSPWFDKESLLPGMKWRPAIKKAIRESDFFLALLSKKSTTKKGYVQTEMKEAFDIWDQFPEGKAYLIPIRLNECEPSYEKLREVQFQDFFPSWDRGFQKVVQVINSGVRPQESVHDSLLTGYEYRCAIVDLDNGLANLPEVCQRLNSIQKFFHFSYPSFPLKHTALREFEGQVNLYVPDLPESFYGQKALLNADLAVCLTRYLLAFEEDDETCFDFLSVPSDADAAFKFITTYGLYDAAKKAGCTFEKSFVYHILTQLLIHFSSDLGFHTEVRGCIMDYCEDHSWMIKGMKKMKLCRDCAKAVENEELKSAVLAILADPLKV